MILKVINGSVNSWTYYEAEEITFRRLKFKDLGKFEYSYHGDKVDNNYSVLQISLCNRDVVKYVVVPVGAGNPVFLMGNNGKTLDKIN